MSCLLTHLSKLGQQTSFPSTEKEYLATGLSALTDLTQELALFDDKSSPYHDDEIAADQLLDLLRRYNTTAFEQLYYKYRDGALTFSVEHLMPGCMLVTNQRWLQNFLIDRFQQGSHNERRFLLKNFGDYLGTDTLLTFLTITNNDTRLDADEFSDLWENLYPVLDYQNPDYCPVLGQILLNPRLKRMHLPIVRELCALGTLEAQQQLLAWATQPDWEYFVKNNYPSYAHFLKRGNAQDGLLYVLNYLSQRSYCTTDLLPEFRAVAEEIFRTDWGEHNRFGIRGENSDYLSAAILLFQDPTLTENTKKDFLKNQIPHNISFEQRGFYQSRQYCKYIEAVGRLSGLEVSNYLIKMLKKMNEYQNIHYKQKLFTDSAVSFHNIAQVLSQQAQGQTSPAFLELLKNEEVPVTARPYYNLIFAQLSQNQSEVQKYTQQTVSLLLNKNSLEIEPWLPLLNSFPPEALQQALQSSAKKLQLDWQASSQSKVAPSKNLIKQWSNFYSLFLKYGQDDLWESFKNTPYPLFKQCDAIKIPQQTSLQKGAQEFLVNFYEIPQVQFPPRIFDLVTNLNKIKNNSAINRYLWETWWQIPKSEAVTEKHLRESVVERVHSPASVDLQKIKSPVDLEAKQKAAYFLLYQKIYQVLTQHKSRLWKRNQDRTCWHLYYSPDYN